MVHRVLSVVFGTICLIYGSPIEFNHLDIAEIKPTAVEDLNYRLTYDVLPKNYKITLQPFFEDEGTNRTFTFKGNVEITLQAQVEVSQIILHFSDMDIHTYSFDILSKIFQYDSAQYNAQYDKWTIPIPQEINNEGKLRKDQTVKLSVEYTGYMRDDMHGFYKSYYMEQGKKLWMGSTQFQPVHARRAFPCFDEPGFKSTFDITIIRPNKMALTLGNTIATTSKDPIKYPERSIDKFDTTPEMSTYLIAFIVSNYVGSFKNTNNFGVYARPEEKPHTDYAVDFGIKMLNEFNKYFGIDYYESLKKMDMAAIPDFSAGAMENWFGDLVTCKWWSETWMNEGFARYFQFMGTAMIEKNWDLEEQFVIENLQQSMQLDSTESTHPMTTIVNSKSDAANIFDNISYNKAASIIRMLSYYVGHADFQKILQRHINDNKYKAVVPEDFFKAIRAIKNADAADFFKSWTIKSGFPVVNASLVGKTLKLTQQRFMRNGISHNKTEKYIIPISIAIDNQGFNDPSYKFVMPENDSYEYILPDESKSYYMLNVQQTGFYRINYVDDNWNKIKDALMGTDMENIHVLNRAQIVDDLFNLARGGMVTYVQAVDIIRYLKNETNYIPWLSAINNGLTHLSQRITSNDEKIFSWFINDLMDKVYKQLSYHHKKNDRRTEIYNRINILTWLCKYGHEECISESKKMYEKYTNEYKKISTDHRTLIYCNAIRYGKAEDFIFLLDKLNDENSSAEQLNILNGLTCTKKEKNVQKLLGKLIRTDTIRPQDKNTVINGVLSSNIEGVDFMYNFITANYVDWKKSMESLATLSTVVGRFTSKNQLAKFEDFLEKEKEGLGDSVASLAQAVNTAKKNLEWDEKYMKEFINHLHKLNSASMKLFSLILSASTLFIIYVLN